MEYITIGILAENEEAPAAGLELDKFREADLILRKHGEDEPRVVKNRKEPSPFAARYLAKQFVDYLMKPPTPAHPEKRY